MRPPWPALLIALVLLVPAAGAVSVREDRLDIAWRVAHAPNVLTAGRLAYDGGLRSALVAADVGSVEIKAGSIRSNGSSGDSLVVEGGTLFWHVANGTNGHAAFSGDYALGLALSEGPEGMGAGALLVGKALHVVASADGDTELLVKGATRIQIGGATSSGDGAFLLGGHGIVSGTANALGAGADVATLSVFPAERDGFADAVDVASSLGSVLGDQGGNGGGQDGSGSHKGSPFGQDSPLKSLETLSPLLNGAVVVVGADSADVPALLARFGEGDFDLGPFTLMRSKDLAVRWTDDGRMTVQGTPSLVISKAGAAVPPTASLFGLPLVSIALWLLALAAVIYFLVRRPEKADAPWSWRLMGWGAWALAFVIAFWVWDASFASTFGTSLFTIIRQQGLSLATIENASIVLGIELLPWALASLLFALPIRIVAGVGLRYLGKGKALKGFAKAAGVLSLALFAPLYGLVLVNAAVALGLKLAGVH